MKTTSDKSVFAGVSCLIALLGLLLTVQPAAAADYVVMELDGESGYKVGDIIESAMPVSLPEATAVTLVSSTGEKVRVEGPFVGTIDVSSGPTTEKSKSLVRSLALLFRTQAEWAKTRNLVRSLGGEPNADPWIFDIEWTGAYCYRNPGDAALWRKQAPQDGTLEISVPGDRITTTWPKGENRLDWPTDMPVADGERYDLRLGKSDSRSIEFKKLPSDLPTRAHMAGWMGENACDDQAVLLMLTAEIDWMLTGLVKSGEF